MPLGYIPLNKILWTIIVAFGAITDKGSFQSTYSFHENTLIEMINHLKTLFGMICNWINDSFEN